MKPLIRKFIFITISLLNISVSMAQNETFSMRVVNPSYQLNSGWELTWGPDDSLWVTENFAYKISRINPADGGKSLLIDLSSQKDFTSPPKWPQGGLMGMALHPSMYSEWPNPSKPFVYVAFVYHYASSAGCTNGTGACNFNTKIVRYTYDRTTHALSSPQVIISTLNGSNDHNSGRLTIGKVGGTSFLFYTIGDMGAGQFNNASRTNNAQSVDVLEGKILRFNLEQDGDVNANDQWIPNDNPFSSGGKATAVWSWGHRNPQGIAFGSNGFLYQSEQQDKSDDEVNLILSGTNYGWPKLSGYCDGNYNHLTLANKTVDSEQDNCAALNAKDPIYTFYTSANPALLGSNYLTWPTIAASSIDVYEKSVIPNWTRSLLVTSLKAGLIYRLHLNAAGTTVLDTSTVPIMRNQGRYRDLCISPDGLKIYVACDISGQTSGPTGSFNGGGAAPANAGRILEFSYTGAVLSLNNDSLFSYARNTAIKISPNPATNTLFVKSIPNISKPLLYKIFDDRGNLVLFGRSTNNNFSIDISKLSRGMYVFKLFNGYSILQSTQKIIKN